jgi:hypothetical protein
VAKRKEHGRFLLAALQRCQYRRVMLWIDARRVEWQRRLD